MNRKLFHYIFITLLLGGLISCSDDDDPSVPTIDDDDSAPIAIGVRSEWVNGRPGAGSRASYFDDEPPTSPEWIFVTCTEKPGEHVDNLQDFLVMKEKEPDIPDDTPTGYKDFHVFYLWDGSTWQEQPKTIYKRKDAKKLTFKAYSFSGEDKPGSPDEIKRYINDYNTPYYDETYYRYFGTVDLMTSEDTYYTGEDDETNGKYKNHLLFTLHHASSLLRLHFGASAKYLTIRDIVLRSVSINDEDLTLTNTSYIDDGYGLQLTTMQPFAYTFPNPSTDISKLEFKCVYDIYDKDPTFSGHRTRKGVMATNRVNLASLLSSSALEGGKLKPGYYYDFKITIDPDYLYVLSEHDNKQHLTIK